jgi:hypothetical protein
MPATVFNQILVMMTAFDTVFALTSVAEFAFVETFHLTLTSAYDSLFVYFLYPMHNVILCCSIFSHVLLALERYMAVCYPGLVYAAAQKKRRKAGGAGTESGDARRVENARRSANNAVRKKVPQTCTAEEEGTFI